MNRPVFISLDAPLRAVSPGISRLWGNPDLPSSASYPFYIDSDGDPFPYVFIGQISLAQLAAVDPGNPLPKTGILSFFAKIDNYLGDSGAPCYIGGTVSDPDAVKVLFSPDSDLEEKVLVDDDDTPFSTLSYPLKLSLSPSGDFDENILFAHPLHREWESWDHPFEDWEILLQIDSFEDDEIALNFMDCGVLVFLISPEDLRQHNFSRVRAIVLST